MIHVEVVHVDNVFENEIGGVFYIGSIVTDYTIPTNIVANLWNMKTTLNRIWFKQERISYESSWFIYHRRRHIPHHKYVTDWKGSLTDNISCRTTYTVFVFMCVCIRAYAPCVYISYH